MYSFCLYSFYAPLVHTLTPSARKRRVACLTFSRPIEGIAKRLRVNMMRRHATWYEPRSATSYLAYSYFGEVFNRATIRCCVRAGVLSGLPSSSALALERMSRPFSQCPEVLPYCLRWRRSRGDRPTDQSRDPPSLKLRRIETHEPTLGFGPVADLVQVQPAV